MSTTPVITMREVGKSFGQTVALSDVSLRVDAGQMVALLGLSGSGKSTLLRMVNGLHRPSAGAIDVLGTDVATAGRKQLRELRRQVGFIFQQFDLVDRLTALENVLSGALGRLRGPRLGTMTYPLALRREALARLERVGLADRAFQRAGTLSGGQQQRVAIARAMMQQPRILLADEPVASLDPETSEQIMDLLFSICNEQNITVMVSLHQVDLALRWADRIVGLRDGRAFLDVAAGSVERDQVMEIYQRLGDETGGTGQPGQPSAAHDRHDKPGTPAAKPQTVSVATAVATELAAERALVEAEVRAEAQANTSGEAQLHAEASPYSDVVARAKQQADFSWLGQAAI